MARKYARARAFDNAGRRRYLDPVTAENWIEAVHFGDDGLVPVVAQSGLSGEVLMVAYADREALERTRDTGRAHYHSRSRGVLWKKGETSGHGQDIQEVRVDCDGDAVLYVVRQHGPACHTGAATCFGEPTGAALTRLARTVADRARTRPPGSYTARLLEDGVAKIAQKVGEEAVGMDSIALTDHGNLHGAWWFYEEAKARKLRPILGFEAYVAFGSRHRREKLPGAPSDYSHLVLLAANRKGYANLIKLSSIGFLEGYYRRPRIDRETLERYQEGIVCLAACLSGEIALYLRQGSYEQAKATAQWLARVFGPDRFWLEVQSHGIPDERVVAEGMFRLAAELGLPVVATNDAHYLRREDAEAHDVLLAIGMGKDLDDPNRFRFVGQESYGKSEAA